MVLRPDERAAEAEKARNERFNTNLKRGVQTAAGIAVAGSGLPSKILPFLNEYIPTDLAMKGISKISPKIGEFLKKGNSMGLDIKQGLDFVKEKFTEKEKPKEKRNVVEQYSPELHQFIDQEIRKGRNALEAGAIAQNDKRFSDVIKKLSKDHKIPWSNILESVYGGQGQAPIQSGQDQQQPQQGQQMQQPGQGLDPQLAQIMGNISQAMQNMRGNRG